jgi:DNA-binding transcriptional ArsR family regulator
LTNNFVGYIYYHVMAILSSTQPSSKIATVRDPDQVAAMLPKQRTRMLEALQVPDSAAGLARSLGLPRQQLNYHLRELERVGLVELVEERRKGNCVERIMRASARAYVISPEVLGALGVDVHEARDRFSSSYLVAVAARTICDLAELRERADAAGQRLATLTLESEVRFASAEDRNAFAKELSDALARLIVAYHDAEAPEGRCFRVQVGAYPSLTAKIDGLPTRGEMQ